MANDTYLITGLCMQGNKGGPAIAISLANELRKVMPSARFVFSVPGGANFSQEKVWAEYYGYQVVENIDLRNFIPPYSLRKSKIKALLRWIKTLREVSAVIQMSAISYVGPPAAYPKMRNLLVGRFMDFFLSLLFRRPMVAWTQSYGPFSTSVIRVLAKVDLMRQPIIFCRGEDCLREVNALLPNKKALSFPDIAVNLPFSRKAGVEYLTKKSWPLDGFVSISPSAVIYSKSVDLEGVNAHVSGLRDVCRYFQKHNIPVIIVPHTFRVGNHSPNTCDYGVAKEIVECLGTTSGVYLVDEDLSPIELKSIISVANFHIGGRYHSVVAALSSGVPAISLSWHPKYKDLMRMYGMEDYVAETEANAIIDLAERIIADNIFLRKGVSEANREVLALTKENVNLFADALIECVK